MTSDLGLGDHSPMGPKKLQHKLHSEIPMSKHMGVRVLDSSPQKVRFQVPLYPNRNHQGTAFGGTLISMQALCSWSWVMMNLEKAKLDAVVVIRQNHSRFKKPVTADFKVVAAAKTLALKNKFITQLRKKGVASIDVLSSVECQGQHCAEFIGEYVAKIKTAKGKHGRI